MSRIFSISLFVYYLYTCAFMWDYFNVFMCVGDVAPRGASYHAIKLRSSIVA